MKFASFSKFSNTGPMPWTRSSAYSTGRRTTTQEYNAETLLAALFATAEHQCAETIYRLDLPAETDYQKAEEYRSLYVDREGPRKMLFSTTKTMTKKLAKGDDTL